MPDLGHMLLTGLNIFLACLVIYEKRSVAKDIRKTLLPNKLLSTLMLLISSVLGISGVSYFTYYFLIKPFDSWTTINKDPKIWPLAIVIFLLTVFAFWFISRLIKRS